MDITLLGALSVLGLAGNPNLQSIVSPLLYRDLGAAGFQVDRTWSAFSEAAFDALRGSIVAQLLQSRLPYHNLTHALKVEARVMKLSAAAGLTSEELCLLRLAALCHDLHYSGVRYRQQLVNIEYDSFSNEEYSVLKADELLGASLTLYERVLLQGAILATSFGQKPSVVKDPNLARSYTPSSIIERILAFADVGGVETTFSEFITDALLVAQETNDFCRMTSAPEFVKSQLWFNSYVEAELANLGQHLMPSVSRRLAELLADRGARIQFIAQPNSFENLTYVEAIKVVEGS